jgi:uncharacterized protein (TIRG00374 family)
VKFNKNQKLLLLAVKVAISAILLTLIFRKAGLQNIIFHLQSMDLRYFILASLLYIVIVAIAALRWQQLLDEKFPARQLFSLYFIGSFFNHILPGTVGGDSVKIYYLYKETRKSGSSIGSVFLDRYIGLVALLAIGLVSSIIANREPKWLWYARPLWTSSIWRNLPASTTTRAPTPSRLVFTP